MAPLTRWPLSPAPDGGIMPCRDARADDAAAVARVHVAAWRAAYQDLVPAPYLAALDADRARKRWEEWLQPGRPVVVVEASGDVVGFCRYGPSRDSDGGPSTGEVMAINLHPAFWRRGLGRELLLAALSRLREGGFTEATLWVLHGNERARRFYEALGWRPDGAERIETELTGSPLHEVRYRLPLAMTTGSLQDELAGFFADFATAFASFQGAQVAALYAVPGVALRADGSIHGPRSRAEIERFFQSALDGYHREGARACRFKDLETVRLGARGALGTVTWELRRDDDRVLREWRQSYTLVRVDGGWQVLASVYHLPPAR